MKNIYNLSSEELTEVLLSEKLPKFRSKQIWSWLYKHNVNSFVDMKNIDEKTRNYLTENYFIPVSNELKYQNDNINTEKVLLKLADGEMVESVLMRQKHGYSVCVTTQIGCKIGCSFCASHLGGFTRNLSTGEIVEQVMYWQRKLSEFDSRVSHIVVMGIGEPMDNLENVLKFIDVINDQDGLKIGARHITVSTSGIVPQMYKFAEYDKQVNLAISLHAPNDKLRSQIMKINNVYNIKEIMDVVEFYINKTNRRVSFEYIMLKDVNDTPECARELRELIRGINCHVNLIPFNSVDEYELSKSSLATTETFADILLEKNIQVTVRRAMGTDIDGACGQLRRRSEND